MPDGKFDHPVVFWLLLKLKVSLAFSASLRVAMNAFAAATTLLVAAAVCIPVVKGTPARYMEAAPSEISNTVEMIGIRRVFMAGILPLALQSGCGYETASPVPVLGYSAGDDRFFARKA